MVNKTLKAEKPFWGEERSVQTTKTGEWETLTFDFTNAPTDMNVLAFMFDFLQAVAMLETEVPVLPFTSTR